jgi:hypothetical protein
MKKILTLIIIVVLLLGSVYAGRNSLLKPIIANYLGELTDSKVELDFLKSSWVSGDTFKINLHGRIWQARFGGELSLELMPFGIASHVLQAQRVSLKNLNPWLEQQWGIKAVKGSAHLISKGEIYQKKLNVKLHATVKQAAFETPEHGELVSKLSELAIASQKQGVPIKFKITGTMDEPKVSWDLANNAVMDIMKLLLQGIEVGE